jgi:Zn-dependent peptidase ImmA (M78 family)
MVAETRRDTGEIWETIRELGRAGAQPKRGGFRVRVRELPKLPAAEVEHRPWQIGSDLARHARKHWDLGAKPIRNQTLAALLGAKAAVFSDHSTVATPMPLGIRTEKSDTFDLYFNRPNPTTRRFAASRLLGDHLYFTKPERLLPATHARTSRQQFQRSFAQEFLCPIQALLEKIQTTQPDDDDFSEAAEYFHVSPQLVRTTLVNNNQLERDALTWAD